MWSQRKCCSVNVFSHSYPVSAYWRHILCWAAQLATLRVNNVGKQLDGLGPGRTNGVIHLTSYCKYLWSSVQLSSFLFAKLKQTNRQIKNICTFTYTDWQRYIQRWPNCWKKPSTPVMMILWSPLHLCHPRFGCKHAGWSVTPPPHDWRSVRSRLMST